MFWTRPFSKMGLKWLGNLIFQLVFKSWQFISFKWLQSDKKVDPNGAKLSIFDGKLQ